MDTLPHCACGTDRDAPIASPEREYSTMGTFYLLWGGTSVPTRVNFRCPKCGEIFDTLKGRAQTMDYVI